MDVQSLRLNKLRIIHSGPKVERIALPMIVDILAQKTSSKKTCTVQGVLGHMFDNRTKPFHFELGQRRTNSRRQDNHVFQQWIGLLRYVNTLHPDSFVVKARVTCYSWLPIVNLHVTMSARVRLMAYRAPLHEFAQFAQHIQREHHVAEVAPSPTTQPSEQLVE